MVGIEGERKQRERVRAQRRMEGGGVGWKGVRETGGETGIDRGERKCERWI